MRVSFQPYCFNENHIQNFRLVQIESICGRLIHYRSQNNRFAFNPFLKQALFLRACSISLLKTPWEKEKLLEMNDFSFSYSVFYPFGELCPIFISFAPFSFCRLQTISVWKSLKFVVWERVNMDKKL